MANAGGIATVKSSHMLDSGQKGLPIAVTLILRDIQDYGDMMFKKDHWKLVDLRFYREIKAYKDKERLFMSAEARLEFAK